jgi:fructose-bisphosphate aldolase class I
MVAKLTKLGSYPALKVEQGLRPLAGGHEVETFCQGLEGLGRAHR